MLLSVCLASMLPFVAYSWTQGYGLPIFSELTRAFTPPKFSQPAPPSCNTLPLFQQPAQKSASLWRKGKGKRTMQTITAAPSPTTPPPPQAPTTAAAPGEVSWVNQIHQQQRFVGLHEDDILEEKVNVPSGTHIRWYKNNVLLQQSSNNSGGTSASSTPSQRFYAVSSSSSVSRVLISTMIYFDCAAISDAGLYRLQLDIPNSSNNWHRNYSIIIVDWSGVPGVSCMYEDNEMAYLPRIYQYALSAQVPVGGSVILPCGYQGLLTDVAWYRNRTLILSDDINHEIRPGGDLLIQQASASPTPVRYACWVGSTAYASLTDVIYTDVYVQE
ncbi:uncharacterized protein LOC135195436 [Macrobrachium nipponense]|uniref:uncharacterized protein LOC135195436 n=1 Tax=Macrobrachium nipponense TaxID=159736 RepID=UPI0030C81821